MTARQRTVRFSVVVACVLAASACWWCFVRRGAAEPIASSGGVDLELPVAPGGAYFLQWDARWAADTVGGSDEPLSRVGCTVCSVAMAASDLGYDIDPKELNARLVREGGYTDRGWLIWGKVTEATEGRIGVEVCDSPTHEGMDACLQAGNIPVVKFFLGGGVPHWVAVVGKSGQDYLVKDPAVAAKKVVKLSDRTKAIVSVRYVQKR